MKATCPHCANTYSAPNSYLNTTITCPSCNQQYTLTEHSTPPPQIQPPQRQATDPNKKKTHAFTWIFLAVVILTAVTSICAIIHNHQNPNTSPNASAIAQMSRYTILDQVRPFTPNPTTKFDQQAYHATKKTDGTWITKGQVTFTDHSGITHTEPYLITYDKDLSIKIYAFNGVITR